MARLRSTKLLWEGRVKNMHKSSEVKGLSYAGCNAKTVVLGMLERGGRVRAGVVDGRKLEHLQTPIRENINACSHIITDEFPTYSWIAREQYLHEVINHIEGYVREHVHTNGIENFWSCLKRGLNGTYVSVEPFHLDAYVAEQASPNLRHKHTDASRQGCTQGHSGSPSYLRRTHGGGRPQRPSNPYRKKRGPKGVSALP